MTRRSENVAWLAVLGGSGSKLPFIEAAHSLGFETLVLDNNPDAPGFKLGSSACVVSLHEPEAVVAKCSEFLAGLPTDHRLAGCIGYVSHAKALESGARLRRAFSLAGPGAGLLDSVNDRALSCRALEGGGVSMPHRQSVSSVAEVLEFMEKNGRTVLKPACGGCGGLGVDVLGDGQSVEDAYAAAARASANGKVWAEVFCRGSEYVINGFVSGGRAQVLLCGRKRMVECRTTVESLSVVADAVILDRMAATARMVMKSIGLDDSFFSMDVIEHEGDVHILDVGVLLDAKVDRLLHFMGYPVYETACRLAAGETVEAECITGSAAIRFLYASGAGRLSIVKRELEAGAVEWEREHGDAVREATDVSAVVGWIMAKGEDALDTLMDVDASTVFGVGGE